MGMTVINQVIIGCWVVLLGFWTISALLTKRAQKRQSFRKRVWYGLFTLLSYLLLLEGLNTETTGRLLKPPIYPLYVPVLPNSAAVSVIAVVLSILGVLLALWARVILGKYWSDTVDVKKGHELVQSGPYAVIRHPIYTGLMLLFLGTAIAIGALGGFLGLIALFISNWIKLKQEEALMTDQFPEAYPKYKAKTKALIPFLF
jgi:protein-S-isoprenylcysteine O-methyltransferase Ste14